MAVKNRTPGPDSPSGAGARLRTVGALILLIGLGGALLVYWKGAPPDLPDDLPNANTSKKVARDIEINSGQTGLLLNDLQEDLQEPGVQAVIIAVVTLLAAFGCFFVAQLQARGKTPDRLEER